MAGTCFIVVLGFKHSASHTERVCFCCKVYQKHLQQQLNFMIPICVGLICVPGPPQFNSACLGCPQVLKEMSEKREDYKFSCCSFKALYFLINIISKINVVVVRRLPRMGLSAWPTYTVSWCFGMGLCYFCSISATANTLHRFTCSS